MKTTDSNLDFSNIRLRLWLAAVMASAAAALLLAAGCRGPNDAHRFASAGYLGSASCEPCHPKECKLHAATRHAGTLRKVTRASMGKFWPAAGPLGDSGLEFFESGDQVSLGWKGQPSTAVAMEYALGSEKLAFTFLRLYKDNSVFELRETYFPTLRRWLRTPGQQSYSDNTLGLKYDEPIARHCLSCHATALPDKTIEPEARFMGVGCESCHGPGKEHVEAARTRGARDLHMEKLQNLSPAKLDLLCGRCHRSSENILPEQEEYTQRFTAYGLMKSKCFVRSGEAISCSTCHDPHMNSSTDHKQYEAVCLSCHAVASGFGPSNSKKKSCPVNPRTGCIPCHMPKRIIDKTVLPIAMSDHNIQVFAAEEKGQIKGAY